MSKKLVTLRRLVDDLSARYGADDPDVVRLNQELTVLIAGHEAAKAARNVQAAPQLSTRTAAQRHFKESEWGELH